MSILKSTAVVSLWTGFSRVFGFVRDIVIANKLGASGASDAFFVALLLPNLLRRLLAEGGFGMAFIPLFSRLDAEAKTEGEKFAAVALTWLLIMLVALMILAQIFMEQIVGLIAFSRDSAPDKFDLAVLYGRITFPYLFGITLAALFGGICNARQKFAAFAFMPILLNISFLGCLLVLPEYGIKPAMAASLAVPLGGVVQAGFMYWALRQLDFKLRLAWPPKHPDLGKLFKRLGPISLTVGVLQLSFIIDTKFAATIENYVKSPEVLATYGSFAVSYLNYANKFYQFPLALIGIAMATVLLPHFSRALAKNDIVGAKHAFDQCLISGVALAASAMAGLMLLAEPLMRTFFEHGDFTATDARLSAWAMMAYAAGLPGYIMTKITMSAFYANEDTVTPVKIAIATLVMNVIASLTLMPHFGHVGIAAGTAISGWFNALLQLYIVQRQGFIALSLRTLATPLLKGLGLGVLMLLVLQGYEYVVPFGNGFFGHFAWMIGAILLGLSLFTVGADRLQLFDVRQVVKKFLGR